ncbi:MAG TPA: ATP-binding protein [Albitalea sp.]|uniref:sensor histidine kinase n=1 Tax=Piscinibacter sp. TaxID=1903157 RepID=UPI002ED09600
MAVHAWPVPDDAAAPRAERARATSPLRRLVESRWPWLAASLALTLGLFVSTAAGWFWYADQREAQARRSSLDLLWLEQTVQQTLELNRKLLVNWSRDLIPPSSAASAEFVSRIAALMKDNPALLAIDQLDASGRRVAGWPAYVERPARLPPVNDPLIAAALTRSRTLGQPAYSHVIEQGAPLWVLAVPIDDDGRLHGSLLATYDLDRLLEQEVPWWFVQRYDLSLVDRHYKRLSPRDGALPDGSQEIHKLTFGPDDSGLALWASPHVPSQPHALLAWLALAVVLFALLIIWLLRVLQRWLRERQAAQQALSDSREQLYAVLAGLETAVSVTALDDGRLLFRNRHHAEIFGLQAEGECCLLPPARTAPLDPQAGSAEFSDATTGRWYHLERRSMQWVDGSTVLLDIATDITAVRQAARTARERDELLQHTARLASLAEFASGIAHELNQPLAAIANYSAVADSFLASTPPQMKKLEDAVARMGEEAHRAGQIIQSLRSFIQKRTVEHRTHRVTDLLSEPLALLEPLAQRLQVPVRVRSRSGSARIDCDGVMIEQVLFNLLRNALESVAERGLPAPPDAVTVEIADDGNDVTICVADRGAGIADPTQLFRPFYTTKTEGMGLGLAICRTVVESHGGRLWAEANVGGGARLSFRLPRSTLAAA